MHFQPSCPSFAIRRFTIVLLVVVASAASVLSTAAPARAAGEDLGAELMRLTNLDRRALGRSTLAIDPTLAAFATNATFTCPSNSSMTLHGRATDMAERSYFSHGIKNCVKSDGTEYGALDIMDRRYGYNTYRGENIAWNTYPTGSTATYDTGCAVGQSTGCPGASTSGVLSVVAAEQAFMNSAGHRSNILGDYDRFGCGATTTAAGRTYYACLFSKGGPTGTTTTTSTTPPTTPAISTSVTDTTRPRVTRESGKRAVYRRGYARRFYATLSDNVRIRSAAVYLDGRRIKLWSWSGTVTSTRRSVLVPSWRLKRGTHTLVWRVRDASGNVSTRLDGRVVFTIR